MAGVTSIDTARAPWLATEDRRLSNQIRQLLAEMLTISESPALRIVAPTTGSKQESKSPGEVQRDRDGHPREDWSLHEHYHARFVAAHSDLSRRVILCQGRVSLRERTHGLSPHKIAGHRESLSSEVERQQREQAETLIAEGDGTHAAEIAAETGWPIDWIRTVRERAGRDGDYGHERPKFRELDDAERRALIGSLRTDGLDQRSIARRLGVSKTTIARYWPTPRARVA